MKNGFFSKEAIKYLQSKYPHVTESMFNGLLSMFGLETIKKLSDVNDSLQIAETRHLLKIPEQISNALGVASEINFPDTISAICYVPEKSIDAVDALTYAYEHMTDYKNKSLLTIELDDIDSVPKVFYKGEKIEKKVHVSFDYKTKTGNPFEGGNEIHIEHFTGKRPDTRTIKHNNKR
ncbi:hypothetical protein [Gracilibacillus dipsosauri]|uniref:Uncharacterized protein n=1 Tax=Gracilibacillus dipsosauri TaxID=178340 RepID=A0A317KXU0_9BACI|nr:hypothetical protein [Gracilibacillus dipsosauri]PWU68307.1 hypothetical protein DLJ74_07595 [Gracilibacillus dipsosauri]